MAELVKPRHKVKSKAPKIQKEKQKIQDTLQISCESGESNSAETTNAHIDGEIIADSLNELHIETAAEPAEPANSIETGPEVHDEVTKEPEPLAAETREVETEPSYVYSEVGAYSNLLGNLEDCEILPTAPPISMTDEFVEASSLGELVSEELLISTEQCKVPEGPQLVELVDGFNIKSQIEHRTSYLGDLICTNEQLVALTSLQQLWHDSHKPSVDPLFQLLTAYLETRRKGARLEKELNDRRSELAKLVPDLWSYWPNGSEVTEKASCRDGRSFVISHKFSLARLNKDVLHTFQTAVAHAKNLVNQQVWPNSVHMTLLSVKIHNYVLRLQKAITDNPAVILDQLMDQVSSAFDVLFHFVRVVGAVEDDVLNKQLREWISALAVIFRNPSCSWQLNLHFAWHVLRTPPSGVQWAVEYVRCEPQPESVAALLSLILMPVHEREDYFADRSRSPWAVLSEDGDDDEIVGVVVESTLVKLMSKVPFHEVLKKYMLKPLCDATYSDLLSYLNSLLSILQVGLTTYGTSNYHHYLIKLLGKIVNSIMVVATTRLEMFPYVSRNIQATYDEFIVRCVSVLLSCPPVWQYIAGARYLYVSFSCRWQLYMAIVGLEHEGTDTYPSDLSQRMTNLDPAEQSHLMAALTSLALKGSLFLRRAVLLQIFYAGFISPNTKYSAYKDAKELLASLVADDVDILSELLPVCGRYLDSKELDVDSNQAELWYSLPANEWTPSGTDVALLTKWLAMTSDTAGHRLARCILRHLDYSKMSAERQKDIAAVVVRSGLPCLWLKGDLSPLWGLLCQLRLHLVDRNEEESILTVPDLSQNNELGLLISQGNLGAVYLALQTTTLGHSVPLIYNEGFKMVRKLYTEKCYEPAFACIDSMTTLYWNCPESLASSSEFIALLGEIVVADESFIKLGKKFLAEDGAGPILKKFAAMIHSNMERSGASSLARSAQMWMGAVTALPLWQHCAGAVFLADIICCRAFGHPAAWMQVLNVLEQALPASLPAATLSPLSLFRSTPKIATLLPQGYNGSANWFAYAAITVEFEVYEKRTSMWHELLRELWNDRNKKVSVDRALKKVCTSLKLPVRTSSDIAFYRWAEQALAMPESHPLNILVWNKIFTLYLARVPGVVDRGAPGAGFFQGVTNGALKKRLAERITSVTKAQPEIQKFALLGFWLDEPKLLESSYHVNLPSYYDLPLLATVLEGEEHVWVAMMPLNRMREDNTRDATAWLSLLHRVSRPRRLVPTVNSNSQPDYRIEKLLQEFPKHSDSFGPSVPLVSLFPGGSRRGLVRISYCIERFKETLKKYEKAKANLNQVESSLLRNVGRMYDSRPKTERLEKCCVSTTNDGRVYQCRGPAVISLHYLEWYPKKGVLDAVNGQVAQVCFGFAQNDEQMKSCIHSICLNELAENVESLINEAEQIAILRELLTLWSQTVPSLCSSSIRELEAIILKIGAKYFPKNQEELVRLIRRTPNATFLQTVLQPHLIDKDKWLAHYEDLLCSEKPANSSVVRFNMTYWLSTNPRASHISRLITIIIGSIEEATVPPDMMKALRSQLMALLDYDMWAFKVGLQIVIDKRLRGNHALWTCLVETYSAKVPGCALPASFERETNLVEFSKLFATKQMHLSADRMEELIGFVETMLIRHRSTGPLFDLYDMGKTPILYFIGMLAFTAVKLEGESGLSLALRLLSPWLVLYSNSKTDRPLPFYPEHAAHATLVVALFEHVIRFNWSLSGEDVIKTSLSQTISWYSKSLAVDGISKFVLSVVHHRLKLLPWEKAVFSVNETDVLLKINASNLHLAKEFVGNVFLAVDWDKLVFQSLLSYGTEVNCRLHAILLELLVRVSLNCSSEKNSSCENLLDKSREWAWHLLDAEAYSRSTTVFATDCRCEKLLERPSQAGPPVHITKLLQLLRVAGSMSAGVKHQHPTAAVKRHHYVHSVIRCVAETSTKNNRTLTRSSCIAQIHTILSEIELALNKNVAFESRVHEGMALLAVVLRLLTEPAWATHVEEGVVEWLGTFQGPILNTALLQCAGVALDNPILYASLCEAAIDAYFKLPGNLAWRGAMGTLSAYANGTVPVDQVLISNGCLLTLHCIHLQRMALQPHDGRHVLTALLQMLSTIKPSLELEPKLVLAAGMALMLSHDQPDATGLLKTLAEHALAFTVDRNAGFLTTIGLRKSTCPSISFKLLCLTLSAGISKLATLPSGPETIAWDRAESDKQFTPVMGHLLTLRQEMKILRTHTQLCMLIYTTAAQLFDKSYFVL